MSDSPRLLQAPKPSAGEAAAAAPDRPSAADLLSDSEACTLMNVAVSRGRVPFVEQLLQTRKLSSMTRTILRLDGRGLSHDLGGILQCLTLLRDSGNCASLSTFVASHYCCSSFGPSAAHAVLVNLPGERARIETLILRQFSVTDDVLQWCCRQFPSLTRLDVADNETLYNVPSAIQSLTRLTNLNLSNCSNLLSLPDELLKLRTSLTTISALGCTSVKFPPPSIVQKGASSIFDFLKQAQDAKPLKRVKVLFLGNGRSGKTSLLRALAKQPLQAGDAGPSSTVGVSVNTLDKELKPGFLEKCVEQLPDMTYWDFAGQLEYSAAHDFFLSTRQAVYVIIYSVMDDRESQMHQVACVFALMQPRCMFERGNTAQQVLAAHRVHARHAARALLHCGHQGG